MRRVNRKTLDSKKWRLEFEKFSISKIQKSMYKNLYRVKRVIVCFPQKL
ncbi:hypothetical protein CSE_00420 [Caldisericum exile AZM16c01]|uniref:Uncharacterized protein n=1 Tax=Caldisericum exile (strain DSM 21853 / NBRC 104410 / AZM16c01) TaxID=511051 RepID=A0A7U6GD09_CALEA|nr:hypothetical protein CSE_00420 [Caldisericum exile AZM16c01]